MPITTTPAGGYEVSACVNRRRLHRRLPPGSTAREAKRVEAELIVALGGQPEPIQADPPLVELMAEYLTYAETLRSPDTARYHALRIGRWVDGCTASQARIVAGRIVKDMRGHYAPATINRSLGALQRSLSLAWKYGRTPVDYSTVIERLPEHNQRTVYLTVEQVAMLAEAASENVRAAIWIALLTGCRRGEVCKIKAADIGEDTIRLQAGNTKTLRYREVPIVAALRPWLRYLPLPINYEGVKSGFRRAREKVGMEHVHFHDLRHSCATILLANGAELLTISRILGHTSVQTTQRYAHMQVDAQRNALERAFG